MISVTFSCTVSIFLKDSTVAPNAAAGCPQPTNRKKREDSDIAEKEVSISTIIRIKGTCLKARPLIISNIFKFGIGLIT